MPRFSHSEKIDSYLARTLIINSDLEGCNLLNIGNRWSENNFKREKRNS